jgi:F-type H+-transporting ATPase subunit b
VPQFEPANFLPQLAWLAVIFTVLYFAVVRPTLPKVGRIIDEREGRVAGDLDAAEAAKGEADAIRTRYDDGMATAREAAQGEVAAAHAAAATAAEARMKELGAVLDARAAEATTRIDASRAAAKASLAATTADLTGEAVARLTGLDVPPAEIEAALAAQK